MMISSPALRASCNCCSDRVPTGRIILPPSASCSIKTSGMRGAAAATRILSKGACSGSPTAAIALHHVHVLVSKLLQILSSFLRELRLTFNRPNFRSQLSQNCGFVAGACAHFQNAICGTQLQLLQHGGDDVWLRDGLSRADGQRKIAVGFRYVFGGNESFRVEPLPWRKVRVRRESRVREAAPRPCEARALARVSPASS